MRNFFSVHNEDINGDIIPKWPEAEGGRNFLEQAASLATKNARWALMCERNSSSISPYLVRRV